MKGFIGVTDNDWFAFLRYSGCRPGAEEGGPPDGYRYRLLKGVGVCTRHVAQEESEIQAWEIKAGKE